MSDHVVSLDTLYARFDAIAGGSTGGDSRLAHRAVLDRLATDRQIAEARGWTSCALERIGGTGRLRLWGVPPSGSRREVVPDWLRPLG